MGCALLVTVALVAAGLTAGQPATAAPREPVAHFVVLAKKGMPLARTEASVRPAGGRVVRSWPQIGVVVATSPDAGFAAAVRPLPGVLVAGATRDLIEFDGATPARRSLDVQSTVDTPAMTSEPEPLAAYQWSLRQIRADRAHEISGGSRQVVVGVLDAGVDAGHPDLAPSVDASRSVGCGNEGVPDTSPAAWGPLHPDFSHGTAVAGIIAAARNGVGVAGVAPNVRIASVRIGDTEGWVYPEYVICGYVWAAEHGIAVTNASIFADPWLRWCDDDPDQAAVAEAMRRAIDYAARRGVVNVAAIGNTNWDLSHPVLDTLSPLHDPTERLTGDNCQQVPAEIPGVVAVSSVGAQQRKARSSSYGIRDVDVTAPGGDAGQLPDTPDGNPGILTSLNNGQWGYFGGTSAASPHAAGVAALIRSTHPHWTPRQVTAALTRHADRIPCPPGGVYDPDGTGAWLAHCEGGRSGQGFYGHGLVDALDAVRQPQTAPPDAEPTSLAYLASTPRG